MNLGEAEKSFDYFTDLLQVQSTMLTVAADLEAKSASPEMAPQARETRVQALLNLEVTQKNSLIIGIIVHKEMTRHAELLISMPMELAKVTAASTRMRQAERKAQSLIEQQEKKQAEDLAPKVSATSKAISEFLEKHEREQAERRRKDSSAEPHS
jgi:hypothetical protein